MNTDRVRWSKACARRVRCVGRGHQNAQQEPERIYQDMSFAPFDPFGRVITDGSTVRIGLLAQGLCDSVGVACQWSGGPGRSHCSLFKLAVGMGSPSSN